MVPNADGPDLSHWNAYTGQPFDPAWRVWSLKCSEGARAGDATFAIRWAGLRERGVEFRGAYHWIRSDSAVAAQADNLCRRLGELLPGEFVQCDWETTPGIPLVGAREVAEWCDRVEQHYGRRCVIVYSSDWIGAEFANWRNDHPAAPLWYANYNTSDRPTGGWAECARWAADVWQWTSSYRHPSIAAGFDMNHVFDWSTLATLTAQTAHPQPTPPPIVTPPPEDTMHKVIIDYSEDGAGKGSFTLDGIPLDQPMIDALVAQGYTRVASSHPYWRAAVEHRNGARAATMYGATFR